MYHGATVTNPVYGGYPRGDGTAAYAWYPAPYYYGGAFWGAFAVGAAAAVTYGTIVAANSTPIVSYEVQPSSPGAKLLASYKLTQTQCGKPNLVVIFGPNNSVICAIPNSLVVAGNYSVNTSTLTIVSEKPAAAAGASPAPSVYAPPNAQQSEWSAIHIRSCTVLTRGSIGLETGGIEIEYSNLGPVTATQVVFGVLYRGQPALVTDSGTFSQGALIKHTFTNVLFGLAYGGPTPEICRVRRATFENGTVSQAPPLTLEPTL